MDATVIPLQELVTSLSINPNGNQVVLAAKRGLFLLDLTKPFVPPIAFKHNTKWEVTDVVWNPHREHANWIASTSNQKVLIWNIDPTGSMNVASALPTHSSSAVAPPYPGSSNGSTPTPSTPATHSSKSFRTSINTPENHRLNNLSRPNPLISTASITQHQNVEIVLHNHKRAVSDFHWSPFRSEVIATCGYDNFVHVWDLRARSGSSSGSTNSDEGIHGESAGATAVKWNRLSEFVLASSHDTDLRVWDIRYGSKEVALISAAHMTKIYGIDWSPRNVDEIITCSQDQCVKFWNINETRKCDGTIVTSTPVWRARFTPFGNGIVTMPLRKEFDLTMWAADNLIDPVTAFTGHTDVVKEFVWRNCGDNDYQLVTFSKDQTLRLWPIDKKVQIVSDATCFWGFL
ncbi:WD40-repeat-containing domain protein [Obelidium mucronatum]|nr:WD40-repeat-containing domain protein [Obelidium mucronatum]